MARALRFARGVWACRSIRTWQMVTACWKQSDPDWLSKMAGPPMTDAEWDAYCEAMSLR